MDLQALNSGTPASKQWLTPVCASITAGEVLTTPDSTEITTTPVTLSASQLVGGLVWMPSAANNAVQLPSADDFKAYFGSSLQEGITFPCSFYRNSTGTTAFTLGAGTSLIDRGNTTFNFGSMSAPPLTTIILTYQFSLGSWSIYQNPRCS